MTLTTILMQAQAQGSGWTSIIMMVALIAIFYFFMIRPQQKRQKEIQKARAEHCDSIVDKYPNQRVFIQGWFNRINDIGRKCGYDTIYESKHLK